MVLQAKYVVHDGYIKSRSDGDEHFISCEDVIRLYGVNSNRCLYARMGDEEWKRCYTPEYIMSLTHLWPRLDGNYNLAEVIYDPAQ